MYTLVLPKFRIFAEKLERMNFWFSCVLGRIKSLLFDLHLLLPVRQRDCVAILRSGVVFLRRVMWWPGYDEPFVEQMHCVEWPRREAARALLQTCTIHPAAVSDERGGELTSAASWLSLPLPLDCRCTKTWVCVRVCVGMCAAWVCLFVCACLVVGLSLHKLIFSLFLAHTSLACLVCGVCVCVYVCLGVVVCAVYPCDMCVCVRVCVFLCVVLVCAQVGFVSLKTALCPVI